MLILLWLLAGLGLGRSLNVSTHQIELSINRTIDTVEKMIKEDPTLPRLNRRDILNILHNITSGNPHFAKIESMTRDAYKRALMIVLPHSTNNVKNNLKELYTKPPLIQMIPNSAEADAVFEIGKPAEIVFPPNPKEPSPFVGKFTDNTFEESEIITTKPDIKIECKEITHKPLRNHRHSYSELSPNASFLSIKINESKNTNTEPERFTFNLANLDQITKSAQEYISSTKWPVYKGTSNDLNNNESNDKNVAIVYSTSVTTKPTTETDKMSTPSANPMKSLNSDVLKYDQWRYLGLPITLNNQNNDEMQNTQLSTEKYIFLPTMSNLPGNVNTFFELPQKKTMNSYTVIKEVERPAPVYVTPMSSVTSDKTVNMGRETFVEHNVQKMPPTSGGFSIATNIVTSVKPIDMLESVGLRLKNQDEHSIVDSNSDIRINKNTVDGNPQMKDVSNTRHSLTEFDIKSSSETFDNPQMDMSVKASQPTFLTAISSDNPSNDYQNNFNMQIGLKDTNHISNIRYNQPVGLAGFDINSPSIATQNTFNSPQIDFKKGVDNLSPDVRLLFQRFGLQTSLNQEEDMFKTTTTKRPTTTTSYLDSFTSFKRLPSSSVENQEMRDFLAKFGLGNGESRNQKSMKLKDNVKEYPMMNAVSFDMRKALENLGLLELIPRNEQTTSKPKLKSTGSTKLHVFKPHESSLSSEDQRQKINKLLHTVKIVQEGKIHDVEKVVTDLVQTTKSLQSGPDPVNLEEILKLYNEDMKSQVKQRQAIFNETEETTLTSIATAGIQRLLISLLGVSRIWVGKVIDELTVVKDFLINATAKLKHLADSIVSSSSDSSSSTPPKSSIFDTLDFIELLNKTEDSSKNGQADIAALEESFGGSTAAPDPVLPTRPKTGLYFLVDWNTFLEVGEEGKDKVNLRFQPKVGDRTRFLPVKIP